MKKTLTLSIILLLISSCFDKTNTKKTDAKKSLKENFIYKCKENKKENEFSCKFDAFNIRVKDVEAFQNEEFVKSVYLWFVNNGFYGNEIYALNEIYFNGTVLDKPEYGSYTPLERKINIFPNNYTTTSKNIVPRWIAEKFGKTKIDPKSDLEYWKYTIFHEYGHHQSILYGSTGDSVEIDYYGTMLYDFNLNDVGKQYMKVIEISKRPEFKDKTKITPILPFSSGSGEALWPKEYYGVKMNRYLWTNAEIMTRMLSLLTYQLPEELHQPKSVLAFGGIIDDYWWLHKYNVNWYEKYRKKDKTPIQKPVDEKLNKWSKFIDDEWFNDDASIGQVYIGIDDKNWNLYLQSRKKDAKYNFSKIIDKTTITSNQLESFTRTKYNWRPFDSRKSKEIELESVVYKMGVPLKGEYWLKDGKIIVMDALDLELGETKKIRWDNKTLIEFIKEEKGIKLKVV